VDPVDHVVDRADHVVDRADHVVDRAVEMGSETADASMVVRDRLAHCRDAPPTRAALRRRTAPQSSQLNLQTMALLQTSQAR
jgi:hypothetical protein